MKYVDPSGEWLHIVVGAVIGGVVNLATNWDNVDGFWQGVAAFGVGAGAGATTAATGGISGVGFLGIAGVATLGGAVTMGVNSVISQTGHNFSGIGNVDWGQVGISSLVGGVSSFAGSAAGYWAANSSMLVNGISSPVLRSAVVSPLAAGAGRIAGGITAGLLIGQSLEAAFENSFKGIGESMLIGTALGVATTVGVSYAEGINPWTGRYFDVKSTSIEVTAKDLNLSATLERIKNGESLPFSHDGTIFNNRESILSQRVEGFYKEYVHPTSGIRGPGAQRIVVGGSNEWYYSPDHYKTFIRFKP